MKWCKTNRNSNYIKSWLYMLFSKHNDQFFPPLTDDCARELYDSKIKSEVDSLYNISILEITSTESTFSGF